MAEREPCVPGPLAGGAEMLDKLLLLEDVCQQFKMNNGEKVTVLKNLTLSIMDIKSKPQILSLLGPSGAGKTTTLRIIAALDKPSSGRVLISNGDEGELRPVRIGDIGVVFQK